jgi:1-acyl-sn-glycerol-3-phosphate acyltransferase
LNQPTRFYRNIFAIAKVILNLLYRPKYIGTENIPDGAAMICGNHSGITDPFLVAMAFGKNCQLYIVTKVELFRIPVISSILRGLDTISIDRKSSDMKSIKTILGYLKSDNKVLIFPEGTRSANDDETAAKNGAIKLAERANVPIVPVYISRKKRLFRSLPVVIGESYMLEKIDKKRTTEDYSLLSDTLMQKISSLKADVKKI